MKPNENEFVKFWLEDGIVHSVYKVPILTKEIAESCIDLRLKNLDGNTYPIFVDSRIVKNVTKEARETFSSHKGTIELSASAFWIESPAAKLIGNFIIKINKPNIPSKLFLNKHEALNWLKAYIT